MPNTKTAWPTVNEVKALLNASGIPLRSGVNDTFYTEMIDAVVADLELKTHRQFIADTVDSTRKFHGSGTGEQIVDDLVSFTEIEILGWAGIAAFSVLDAVIMEHKTFPKNKFIIAEGTAYQFVHGVFNRFPEGRANVSVTAKWGFGLYIPDNVWEAVRGKACSSLASYFVADSSTGRTLQSWIDGSSAEKYGDKTVGELHKWDEKYSNTVDTFKRPIAERMQVKKRIMI